ncbi:MAG: argininosuccinate lyase [Brevirhabdus sp.]
MKQAVLFMLIAALAACGVDGEPVPPEPKAKPGVSMTGKVEIGVKGSI